MSDRISAGAVLLLLGFSVLSCSGVIELDSNYDRKATLELVNPVGTDSMTVRASLAATKTELGDNGRDVLWKEGDQIGVYTYSGGIRSYRCYTLISGAGTSEGVFGGEAFSGRLIGAFYPYSSSVPSRKKPAVSGHTYMQFRIEPSVDHIPGGDDFAVSDFKVASSFEEDGNGGYNVRFEQKLTLLDFKLLLTPDMMKDRLLRFQMSTPYMLAGDFYMDIEDPESGIEPIDGTSSNTVEVVFNGEEGIEAPGSGELHFRMVVLPTVKAHGDILFRIWAVGRHYEIALRAAKDYLPGYRYGMTLDMASIEAAGKMSVIIDKQYFHSFTDPGIVDLDQQRYIVRLGEGWQYGWNATEARFLNWTDRGAVVLEYPSAMMPGSSYDFPVSVIGNVSGVTAQTVPMEVTRTDTAKGLYWLEDQTGGRGYIIMLK